MNSEDPDESEIIIDEAKASKLWIHCNCCFEHYVDEQSMLFLLACQHVICEKCVTASLGRIPGDAPTYTCPICRKNVRGRQVNNALPTNLKDMFHPEPWRDGLPHDLIDAFQKANINSLDTHISKKEKEELKLDKDIQLARTLCRKHYLEGHRLRATRKQLEFRARRISHIVKIRREEAQRRLARRRAESPKQTDCILQGTKNSHSHSESSETRVRSHLADAETKTTLQYPAITSFVHHRNNSFVL
ncbi:RING finger protein vilya [Drosophila virilis]|uniref:RING-type domain-containing protein n=1 Tax=Drosophila virilis TaxID=7244 RepID=B4M3S0_DROVI|nr:RING finger protein vilya [Drosophila virilis]EDW65445.1 uncharacterized protein Dvir_GJ18899 [Drosophila virilis]